MLNTGGALATGLKPRPVRVGVFSCVPHRRYPLAAWVEPVQVRARGSLGASHQGTLAGQLVPKPEGSRACWSRGAQASCLKPKCYGPGVFQGALCLCVRGTKAGVVQSTNQGYPTVHRALASLVRQLGLVGGRGPGFTEVAGQAGNGTVYWSMISRCGGNMDYVHQPLLPRGDCSSTLTTDGVLGLALLYGNHSFKPWFVCFFPVPQHNQSWCGPGTWHLLKSTGFGVLTLLQCVL